MIFLAGCGLQPQPTKPKVDVTLPKVQQVRTLADITMVALEWTPFYSENVDGYIVYRGSGGKKLQRIAVIKDRYSSHFLDKHLKPNTLYTYSITTFTKDNKESAPSEPVSVRTLPIPDSVSFFKAIDHLPKEVKLIWRPHSYAKVQWYMIERSEPGSQKWKRIATLKGRLHAEYIDKGLKDNKIYLYRMQVKTCDGIISKYSKVLEASTKARPKIVQGLQATTNLPKKIVLRWQPNKEPDIVYYKVYRSIFEIGPYTVIAKSKSTEYTDLIKEDGVKRYYKVTAVDKDGLESFKQDVPVVGRTLSRPLSPVVVDYKVEGRKFSVSWKSPDKRAVKYFIKKREITNLLSVNETIYKDIAGTSFVDTKLLPGRRYVYEIYAVDENGLVSKPSQKIEFKIEE